MGNFMTRIIVSFFLMSISSAVQAAEALSASAPYGANAFYTWVMQVVFVWEMVKLPIVLPILP